MSTATLVRRQPDSPPEDFSPAAQIQLHGVVELSVDPKKLEPIVKAIVEGLTAITDNEACHGHFPWRTFVTDEYGKGYEQEIGLKKKKERGEHKWTFQYCKGTEDLMRSEGVPLEDYGFLRAFSRLDELIRGPMMKVAKSIDEAYRGQFPGSVADKLRHGTFVFRGVRYLEQMAEMLKLDAADAAMHVDRAGLSGQLWASHPGLCFVTPDGRYVGADETSYEKVAFFPGEKMGAMTHGATGFGTPHGVRDSRRKTNTRTSDRVAIVAFYHPVATQPDVDWLMAHKPEIDARERDLRSKF